MKTIKIIAISVTTALLLLLSYKFCFYILVYLSSTDLVEFHLMSRNVFSITNYTTTLSGINNHPFRLKFIFVNFFGNILLYFLFLKLIKYFSQIATTRIIKGNISYVFGDFVRLFIISVLVFYFFDSFIYISNPFSISTLLVVIKFILIIHFAYFEIIVLKYKNQQFNFNTIENWILRNNVSYSVFKVNFNLFVILFLSFLLVLEIPFFLGAKNQFYIGLFSVFMVVVGYLISFKKNSLINLKYLFKNLYVLSKEKSILNLENNKIINILLILQNNKKHNFIFFGIMSLVVVIFKPTFSLLFLIPITLFCIFIFIFKRKSVLMPIYISTNFLSTLLFLIIVFPKNLLYSNYYGLSIVDQQGSVLYQTKTSGKSSMIAFDPSLLDSSVKEYIKLEDKRFFEQNCILPNTNNWNGISLKSFYLFLGRGGSNINAQTIKNLSKISTKDLSRKLAEQFSSLMLSSRYTTDEILSLYINNINFYGGGFGTGLAQSSHVYLSKSFNEMNDFEKYFTFKGIQIQKYDSLLKKSKTLKNDGFIYDKNNKYSYAAIKNNNNFDLVESYLKAYIQKNNGYGLNDSIVQNVLNESINISKPSKKNQKSFFDYFLLDKEKLNSSQSYISSISNKNCIKIDSAVNKFKIKLKSIYDENVLQLDANNKLYYASIVVDIKSGKIIGEYSNAVSNNLIYLKNPVGSTIKPLLLAHYFEQSKVNPDIFSIKDNEHCMDGNCNDLKTIIGASANNNPFGNTQNLIKSFDDKISNVLYEKKYNNNVDYYKKIDKVRNYNNNNYYLGQSIELNLLNLAQLYQTLLNEGKFNRLSPFEYIYNPYNFNKDKFISKHFNPNSVQVFDINYANKVKSAMKGTFELLPNAKSGHGTQYFLLDILKNNYTYYGKSGTTSEDIGAQFGYSVIATDEILVISKVFYGNPNESIIKNKQNNCIPGGFGSASAGYLSGYIINEFLE